MEEQDLLAIRQEKLDKLRALGVAPYGGKFAVDGSIAEIRNLFSEHRKVRLAGRITAHRNMGKSQFLDLSDVTGRIQVFVSLKELEQTDKTLFELLDIGDHLGVAGECFITRTGEPTVRAEALQILSKALRPLPDKYHGVADVEIKYRQRYLDLIGNPDSRTVFLQRSRIVQHVRRFLQERGFLEVETPMMQSVPGGAAAQPFQTHHKSLDLELYLRIAPELYLKRLLVGGFPKIFELNRNFRNEGISRRHNPEFTMLELYWAYADFEMMAELLEELVCDLADNIAGTRQLEHRSADGVTLRHINLERPWRRARYQELLKEIDPDWFSLSREQKRSRCAEWNVSVSPEMADFELTQQVFEKLVEEKTFDPLFVTHLPAELVPLAKENTHHSGLVDVYELIINGQELSPGYSELNDPQVQRLRLETQAGEETQKVDEDFLLALEYGMPPAGGLGLGIDRLVMLLTGAESIRDVILFPQMKPKSE